MPASELLVLALGGNALSPDTQSGDIDAQFVRTGETVAQLDDWIAAGHGLVIVHGNGPQVGAALRRVELASERVYRLPLHICVADTQGGMGFMITRCLNARLAAGGSGRRAVALVTTVEIDREDAAFRNPTKPIGEFYDPIRARQLAAEYGWAMVEIAGQGFRRVVPSPAPRRVPESKAIQALIDQEMIVIAGGGGGVAIADKPADSGIDAVIDKDATAALLACELRATRLIFATAVPQVYLGWKTTWERPISTASVGDMRRWLDSGEFPPGSMGPKITAGIKFLEESRDSAAQVIICAAEQLKSAIEGNSGTQIAK